MKNKLKILIITHYFPPSNSIASHRTYSWAKYWSKMGHDVTVLTTAKERRENDLNLPFDGFQVIEIENTFYTRLKKYLGQKQELIYQKTIGSKEKSKSLKFLFINQVNAIAKKRGIFFTARMPDFTDAWYFNVVKNFTFKSYDVVVSSAGPYIVHLLGLRFKKRGLIKFCVADYRDLWTQNHIFPGLFPFTIIEEFLEKKVNKTSDLITTVSEPLARKIIDKYTISNVEVIYNGFDDEILENLDPKPFWVDSKIRIVYAGTIYTGFQDPTPLFKAIKEVENSEYRNLLKNLELIFVGSSKGNLDLIVENFQVYNYVKYLGFVKHEDSLRMQRDAHLLLFLEFKSENQDGILTGKLFEYLFSGTQIWAIGIDENTSAGRLIKESNCGICFGENVERIKSSLIQLLTIGKKPAINPNSEILDRYSRKKQAEKLINLILEKYNYKQNDE